MRGRTISFNFACLHQYYLLLLNISKGKQQALSLDIWPIPTLVGVIGYYILVTTQTILIGYPLIFMLFTTLGLKNNRVF